MFNAKNRIYTGHKELRGDAVIFARLPHKGPCVHAVFERDPEFLHVFEVPPPCAPAEPLANVCVCFR